MGALTRLSQLSGLRHIRAGEILLIAGSARRSNVASIRPLRSARLERKPHILRAGQQCAYEITLRPRFFLRLTPTERLEVMIHELWHIASSFDGTLDPARSHRSANASDAKLFIRTVLSQMANQEPSFDCFAFSGEAWFPMWMNRPPSLVPEGHAQRMAYRYEEDVFEGVVSMASTDRSEGAAAADP